MGSGCEADATSGPPSVWLSSKVNTQVITTGMDPEGMGLVQKRFYEIPKQERRWVIFKLFKPFLLHRPTFAFACSPSSSPRTPIIIGWRFPVPVPWIWELGTGPQGAAISTWTIHAAIVAVSEAATLPSQAGGNSFHASHYGDPAVPAAS
jgi:hypothetical protein